MECLKDVQKLNGKLASLNKFLSKSAKKSLPFFKTLKKCTKKSDFQWTQEAEVAFKQINKLRAKHPMLTAPKRRQAIASILCKSCPTRAGGQLHPMEKLVLALLSASRRLKRLRISIKGQILANFTVEQPDEESPDELMTEPEELPEP
ncbi:hypothetical protein Tco_0141108 [Tanacetum coccineum]